MYSIDDIINLGDDEVEEQDVQEEVDAENANSDNEVKKDVKDEDEDKPAKKKRKQSTRPLLNAERLKVPRGLLCMEDTFSKLKFKGHGYEQRDLDTVMTALQHWCHRLYPKFTFDDTLHQIEKLGVKKPVITLKKKIRMNMIEPELFGINPLQAEDESATQPQSPVRSAADPFDSLIDEKRLPLRQKEPSPEIELTEEQKEMIECNRLLAAEKRRARLEAQKEKENSALTSNQEVNTNEENVDGGDTVLE